MLTHAKLLSVLAVAMFVGCTTRTDPYADEKPKRLRDADLIAATHKAVDVVLSNAGWAVRRGDRILVSTGVELDDLNTASSFGRVTGEMASTRLTQRGYTAVEALLRSKALVIDSNGQFVLTREVRELSTRQNATAVMASTYTVAYDVVFVSLRLIDVKSNTAIGAVDYRLPLGPRTANLLGTPVIDVEDFEWVSM